MSASWQSGPPRQHSMHSVAIHIRLKVVPSLTQASKIRGGQSSVPDVDPCINRHSPSILLRAPGPSDRDLRGHTEPHGKVNDTLGPVFGTGQSNTTSFIHHSPYQKKSSAQVTSRILLCGSKLP